MDAADRGAIGEKLYYHTKVSSFRDSIRVLCESIRVSVFVWSFVCLYANAVENREIEYKGQNWGEKMDIGFKLRAGGDNSCPVLLRVRL